MMWGEEGRGAALLLRPPAAAGGGKKHWKMGSFPTPLRKKGGKAGDQIKTTKDPERIWLGGPATRPADSTVERICRSGPVNPPT